MYLLSDHFWYDIRANLIRLSKCYLLWIKTPANLATPNDVFLMATIINFEGHNVLKPFYFNYAVLCYARHKALAINEKRLTLCILLKALVYNAPKIFCLNFSDIIYGFSEKHSPFAHAMIAPCVSTDLPGLIYAVRSGGVFETWKHRGHRPSSYKAILALTCLLHSISSGILADTTFSQLGNVYWQKNKILYPPT